MLIKLLFFVCRIIFSITEENLSGSNEALNGGIVNHCFGAMDSVSLVIS